MPNLSVLEVCIVTVCYLPVGFLMYRLPGLLSTKGVRCIARFCIPIRKCLTFKLREGGCIVVVYSSTVDYYNAATLDPLLFSLINIVMSCLLFC